jgi:DNA-binding MarR family transcriptional regulator
MKTPLRDRRTKEDEATRSWLAVVRAYHLCSELLALRLGAIRVRTADHEILMNLRREPGLSQQALAARCFTAKSHISHLLGELASRGWVKREADPADGRVKRLVLTPAGSRMAERTAAVQVEVVTLMTAGATPGDLANVHAAMSEACQRLLAALERPASSVE